MLTLLLIALLKSPKMAAFRMEFLTASNLLYVKMHPLHGMVLVGLVMLKRSSDATGVSALKVITAVEAFSSKG